MNSPSLSLVQNPVRSRQFVEVTPAPTVQGDFPAVSPLSGGNGMSPTPPDINGIVLRISLAATDIDGVGSWCCYGTPQKADH